MNDDRDMLRMLGCFSLLFLSFIPCCNGCNYAGSKYEFSTGYRDCEVQKFSLTGLVFKTWEGEAVINRLRFDPNQTGGNEVFQFSVQDPTVVEQIQALAPDEKVRLHYRHMLTTWEPNGYTSYFITRVEKLGDRK